MGDAADESQTETTTEEGDGDFITRLEEKAAYHAREAKRYKTAADVIRSESWGPLRRRHNGVVGSMVLTVLDDAESPLDLSVLTQRMLERGWQTDSQNPYNTARNGALRLVERGTIQRLPDGRFTRTGLTVDPT